MEPSESKWTLTGKKHASKEKLELSFTISRKIIFREIENYSSNFSLEACFLPISIHFDSEGSIHISMSVNCSLHCLVTEHQIGCGW